MPARHELRGAGLGFRRELIGELVGADAITDEITCHKTGATFVGDRLGLDLYLVALLTFGLRIFQNVALIRRHFL